MVDDKIDMSDIISKIKKENKNTKLAVLTNTSQEIDALSSGNLALDYVCGCKGLPKGRLTQLVGVENSGKTSIAQMIVASVQKQGYIVAWEDAEKTFMPIYAKKFGINLDRLLIEEPEGMTEAFDNIYAMLSMKEIGLIVVDSVAALMTDEEKEDSRKLGVFSSNLGAKTKKLVHLMNKNSPIILFLNQVREKFNASMFGEQTNIPGGKAFAHNSSLILQAARKSKEKDSKTGKIIGVETKVSARKNKVGFPFRDCTLFVDYRKGVDKYSGLLDLLENFDILKKSGQSYKYGEIIFKKENFVEFFEANKKELLEKMED